MKAEFSEFTYGFSLVNELAKTLSCTAAPILPSLIEEGEKGGGYDAKLLSKRGTILNLQFKLSDYMVAANAREFRIPGHSISLPYYRFGITSARISEQHSLLLELEDIQPLTFYVAPVFHLNGEINSYWNSDSVTQNSVFVRPSSIGDLPDIYPHTVCFDDSAIERNQAYRFSNPQNIDILSFQSFSKSVIAEVGRATEPLEGAISRVLEQYESAIRNTQQRKRNRTAELMIGYDLSPSLIPYSPESQDPLEQSLSRLEDILSQPAHDLFRQIAQISTGIFGTQAIAVVESGQEKHNV